jgi:hypothetical protein
MAKAPPQPWTAQDQAVAEVAVACRVHLAKVAMHLGRHRSVVEYRLKPAKAAARNQRSKATNAANPEANRKREREWRDANPEKYRERKERWLAANPDYFREYHKRRRLERKGGVAEAP